MSDMPESSGPAESREIVKRRRCTLIVAALAIVSLPAVYVWFLAPADVIAEPVHIRRNADGMLVADDNGESSNGLNVAMQAAKLNSKNNTSTSSSEMHSNPAFLADRRLAIFNRSDHLLLNRVASSLLKQLQAESKFDEISYFPSGHQPEIGGRAPDVYMTLDLRSIEESGLVSSDLKASVVAHFGTSIMSSSYSSTDDQSPPTVRSRMDIEVEHESSLVGVVSSGAKYQLQGADIAKQIAEPLLKKLDALREKHSRLPELPAVFWPEWSPEPELPFLDELNAQRLNGGHGLMVANDSAWVYQPSQDAIAAVTAIRDELLADGWREENFYSGSTEHFTLRMEKDNAIIDVFPERKSSRMHHRIMVSEDGETPDESPSPRHYVRYRERLPREVIRQAVNEVFEAENRDIETLLALRRYWHGEQYGELIRLIEERPVRRADAWLVAAEYYTRQKDVEGTRRALACAQFLSMTLTESGDIDRRIKAQAKKMKIDPKSLRNPGIELLATLGVAKLNPEEEPAGILTVAFGEPAAFYVLDDEGVPTVFTVTVKELSEGRYHTTHMESSERSRSWSTGETTTPEMSSHSWRHEGVSIRPQVQVGDDRTVSVTMTMK
ncbi:MAG: hypothetical protein ACYTGL_25700 [Planctomycetota bacterium]|jgi:hypothetical protein